MIPRDRLAAMLGDLDFLAWGTARGLFGGGCPRAWGDGWQSAGVSADRLMADHPYVVECVRTAAERHALADWPPALAADFNRIADRLRQCADRALDPELAAQIRESIRGYWYDLSDHQGL